MPQTTPELVQLLDLEQIELGLFRGHQPRTVMQRTFGGQVLAQALMAAGRTVGDDRECHSLNAYFLLPGSNSSPIIYDVEDLRDGRAFSQRRIVARQDGQRKFVMSASFHVAERGLDHGDRQPSDVPPPEDCRPLHEVMKAKGGGSSPFFHEFDALDVRYASSHDPGEGAGAELKVWVRTSGPLPDDQLLHRAVLAYLSDLTLLSVSTVSHGVAFYGSKLQMASIDHNMRFHRPVRADQWLLFDQVSPSASQALGFATGRLFQDGQLVASCSQEGLIRLPQD